MFLVVIVTDKQKQAGQIWNLNNFLDDIILKMRPQVITFLGLGRQSKVFPPSFPPWKSLIDGAKKN